MNNNALLNNFIIQSSGGIIDPVPISKEGLLFYLDANKYSGEGNWVDLTDNGYNFIPINNPSYVSGGNSYFTFTGENVDGPMFTHSLAETTTLDNWSFYVWLYHQEGADSNYQSIFDKDEDEELFYLYSTTTPEPAMWSPIVYSDQIIETETWYNICCTYQRNAPGPGDGECRFYINGEPVEANPIEHTDNSSPADSWHIGGGYDGDETNELFCGRMAAAALYDIELSDETVFNNYEADKARFGF